MTLVAILLFLACNGEMRQPQTVQNIAQVENLERIYLIDEHLPGGGHDDVEVADLNLQGRPSLTAIKARLQRWFGGEWPDPPGGQRKSAEHLRANELLDYQDFWSRDSTQVIFAPPGVTEREAREKVLWPPER